ncbi:MAG: helix-turn-helix domain-containing protein [Nitrospinae bacterium]|nr:helix-turn-helix domain-containing protein [Nitrospinota bacterium]
MKLDELGQRVRARREERGLTQADVARALQVSAQAVSKWERGENAPDIALLGQLARLLDTSVDWLLGLHGEARDVFEATVFVSSVAGYAARSRDVPPRELAAWANGLYYTLTETVTRHDGVPVKQTGDGVLCFFSGARHRERAAEAARAAARAVSEKQVVALATGEIYLGAMGHPDYRRPDILGDPVNIAFRMLELGARHPEGVILADAATVAGVEARLKGPLEVDLTFIPTKVTLYEIEP